MKKTGYVIFITLLFSFGFSEVGFYDKNESDSAGTTKVMAVSGFSGNLLMPSTKITDEVLLIGKPAPTFVLPDLNNDYIFLRYFCGEKLKRSFKIKNQQKNIVLLSFFASWCVPCKKEIPHLENISKNLQDKPVKLFLVNVGESKSKAMEFLDSLNVSLPVLLDTYKKVSDQFKVSTLPRLVLIDRNGIVRGYKIGYAESEDLESLLLNAINQLLEE
ncbi:MAG: hypothetical protein Kow00108_06490 [Calditrichia bacterium]